MGLHVGMESGWKETAWNGVQFLVPDGWELSKIGRRYLMLDEESGPVLEVKWESIKGSFSHRKHLRRLFALYGKQPEVSIKESPLTKGWQEALCGYEASGFSWSGKTIRGSGVVLFCPMCRTATLIQFYHKAVDVPDGIFRRLLNSFQDHRQDGQVVWCVFDIRAVTPGMFRLVEYRLEPGRFELSLASSGRNLTLYRWGPAAVLLFDRNLKEFAGAMVRLPDETTPAKALEDRDALEWESSPPSAHRLRWWRRFRGKAEFQWFRIWHEKKKNRILGVRFEGKRPSTSDILERVASGYETL